MFKRKQKKDQTKSEHDERKADKYQRELSRSLPISLGVNGTLEVKWCSIYCSVCTAKHSGHKKEVVVQRLDNLSCNAEVMRPFKFADDKNDCVFNRPVFSSEKKAKRGNRALVAIVYLYRVATAQGKQGIWFLLFPDRENTGNFALTQGKILRHRENIFLWHREKFRHRENIRLWLLK